jgi:hypothetical protein
MPGTGSLQRSLLILRSALREEVLILSVAAMSLTGCGPCGYERSVTTRAHLSAEQVVPPTMNAYTGEVALLEVINDDPEAGSRLGSGSDWVDWSIKTNIPVARVTGVELHEGLSGQNGRILLTLPSWAIGSDSLFTVAKAVPYDSAVPIEELIDLITRGRAYVDVHTWDSPEGALRGPLDAVQPNEPEGYYCS